MQICGHLYFNVFCHIYVTFECKGIYYEYLIRATSLTNLARLYVIPRSTPDCMYCSSVISE